MTSHIAGRNWRIKGAIAAQWGQVTGDKLRVLSGRHLQRVGRLDAACGRALDQLGRQFDGAHRRSRALHARSGL